MGASAEKELQTREAVKEGRCTVSSSPKWCDTITCTSRYEYAVEFDHEMPPARFLVSDIDPDVPELAPASVGTPKKKKKRHKDEKEAEKKCKKKETSIARVSAA